MARRLAAVAVLLLSLAIVAILTLRAAGVPVAIGPSPSATPIASTSTPIPSQDQLTVLAAIEDQVQALRGLPAAKIGPPRIMTRAELANVLPGLLEPPLDNATLRALGLLSADQDIVALTNRLYTAQVLGYYDFDAKRMVVVTDAGLTPTAEITFAHEYTHALQDAAFDSSSAQDAVKGDRDRELGLLALEEGDATTSMVLWALAHLSAEEMAGVTDAPVPDMSGIPGWMVTLLEFPYVSGAEFVGQLYASGGWDAVNAAYGKLPASTEQVLHPAAYRDAEAPVEVAALDLRSVVGGDWGQASDTTLGEEWIAVWLEGLGVSRGTAEKAAAGWGGDHLTVATSGSEWVLGWRIAWDAPTDASEFEAAIATVPATAGIATRASHGADGTTVVLRTSSAALLDQVAPLAEP